MDKVYSKTSTEEDTISNSSLDEAVLEAVRLQAEHRSRPKEERLLNMLSSDTSSGVRKGSTSAGTQQGSRKNNDSLLAQVMAAFPTMSEEEARREIELAGG